MSFRKTIVAATLGAILFSASLTSQACFTIIVGKDASSTGEILIAHNEDNDRRIITNQYWVPAADHKAGEMIEFEPTTAKIPQVDHTLGFAWSQTLAPDGYSFSDGFINEKGVVIVTNNCNETFEKGQSVNDGGIGYGIRRLVAERANSAKEGIDLIIKLMTDYGYTDEGRTYTIADHNEAWQVALLRGHRYLARKVGNDEMTFLSNSFSLENVDLKDTKNVIASPDLVEHAIDTGHYKPAKAGDYSDFNFRKAYQPESRRDADWNKQRVFTFMEMMTGKEPVSADAVPMLIKPTAKISPQRLQQLLAGHSKHEKRLSGWYHETMNDIGNIGTLDSVVFQLNNDPLFSLVWRSAGRPSEQIFTPSFPLAHPALAQTSMPPDAGAKAQFHATAEELHYSPDRTIFAFLGQQNYLDWIPAERIAFEKIKSQEEEKHQKRATAALGAAIAIAKTNRMAAFRYLHDFNVWSFNKTLGIASTYTLKLQEHPIVISQETLRQSDPGVVDVILFSKKDFDATKIDKEKTHFGTPFSDDEVELNKSMAKPTQVVFKDINGDGLDDAVISFPIKGATAYSFEGVNTEIYLFTQVAGIPIVTNTVVKIIK